MFLNGFTSSLHIDNGKISASACRLKFQNVYLIIFIRMYLYGVIYIITNDRNAREENILNNNLSRNNRTNKDEK